MSKFESGDLVMFRGWLGGWRAGHVLRRSGSKKKRVYVRTLGGVRLIRESRCRLVVRA